MTIKYRARSMITIAGCLALVLAGPGQARAGEPPIPAAITELLEQSLKNKTGVTFFLNGQALPAVVTKIVGDGTVIGRSQQYDRIVIRLSRVNAVAIQ